MTAHGTWLAAAARRLLRRDTFETMVSPAIADLQCEADRDLHTRTRHYAAIGMVLAWALVKDLRTDGAAAFTMDAWHSVWMRAGWWWAGSIVVLGWQMHNGFAPWHLLDETTSRAAWFSYTVGFLPFLGLAPATIAAAFYLRRREDVTNRTLVVAMLVIVAVGLAWKLTWSPVIEQRWLQVHQHVAHVIPAGADAFDHPDHSSYVWLQSREDLLGGSGFWHGVISVIPFPLLGIVLARSRGWMVSARLLGLAATWFAIAYASLEIRMRLDPWMRTVAFEPWLNVGILLATPLVWLVLEPRQWSASDGSERESFGEI
jgi:hypothetical protein